MGKGGSSTQTQKVEQTTSLPEYARPYYQQGMATAQGLLSQPYTPYGGQRVADFTSQQRGVQQDVLAQQTPGQFGTATDLTTTAGLGSLAASQYAPGQFEAQQIGQPNLNQYQMNAPGSVQSGRYRTPQMGTAQTGYAPDLNYFQLNAPQAFGVEQAQQYMSPFVQQALEPQRREAIRGAQLGQLAQNLGAVRQGTYGGSRQLLATMERERNLGQQLSDIEARGMQSAYESAQSQFERDRAAQMGAQQANLQAALGVQQLGTQTGTQTALANLDAASQANVQNLAAKLQTQGLNAQQAMQAALANQQAELTTGQQNLSAALQTQQLGAQTGLQALLANQQYGLEAQRLAEQSRQFASQQQLAGLAQAGQMGQTLTNIGSAEQQADLARLGMQQSTAAQDQALNQQYLDTAYQDFLRQQNYPAQQLSQYMGALSGVPVSPNTSATYTSPSPSVASQILGTGLGALSAYKALS